MTNIFKFVFVRQMSTFGHVARLPPQDPAHRILSCVNPQGWSCGMGRPLITWLRQMEGIVAGLEMTGCGPLPRRMLRPTGECGGEQLRRLRCKPPK